MDLQPVIFAGLSAFLIPWLDWKADISKPRAERILVFQNPISNFFYYIPWPLFGALLALATISSGVLLNPLQAIYLGLSAPALATKMIKDGATILGGGKPPSNSES